MSIISSLLGHLPGKQATPPPPPPAPSQAPVAASAPAKAWNPLQAAGTMFSSLVRSNPLTAPIAAAADAVGHAGDKKADAGKPGGLLGSISSTVGGWFGAKHDVASKVDGAGAGAAGAGVSVGANTGTSGSPFAGSKTGGPASVGTSQTPGQTPGQVPGQTPETKPIQAPTQDIDPAKATDPAKAPEVKPPPDPKKIAADANALGKAMDAFIFTDKKAVADTLRGKSAEEIAAIKEEYRKHYGRELDADIAKKLGTNSKDPLIKEVQTSLEGNPAKSYMESIQRASKDGWFGGADKDKLKNILSGMDEKTRAEVRAQFKGPDGQSLDQLLGEKLKGSDLNEARAYVDGNKAAADAAKIDDKMHGGLFGNGGFLGIGLGRDNKGIEQIVDSAKDKEALRKAYETQTNLNLDKDITKDLSGTQKNITAAVLQGDKSAADAGRVKQATEGWFTDKNAIYKAMEGKKPEDIAKMKETYNEVYGKQKGGVTGSEMNTVGALTLVGSPLAPIAAFDAMRKHRSDGMDFDTMLSANMGGLDLEKAKRLEQDGKVSDAFALKYALHSGFFTDKAEVKKILGGKDGEGLTKPELDKLRQEFIEEQKKDPDYKPGDKTVDLDTDVRKNTGSLKDRWASQSENKSASSNEFLLGRDGLEIRQLLRGKASSIDEQVERANETYDMERNSSMLGANTLFDAANGRGKTLDRQNQLMNATLAKLKAGTATDADRKELQDILGRHQMDVAGYQETKDSVSNAAAATVTITITAAATIATGGGASPLLAASIAAAGGTGAMATKVALQGGAYSYDDARSDLVNTAIQTGTAGMMKLPAVDKALNGIVGIAPGAAGTLTQQATKEFLSNASVAGLNSLGQTAINPATYQGDPNQAFWNALRTAGASAVGSGLTGTLNKIGSAKLPQGYLNTFGTGVGSAGAGTLATNILNPAGVTGSSGDQAATWITTLLGGGISNMASLKAERNQAAKTPAPGHTEDSAGQNRPSAENADDPHAPARATEEPAPAQNKAPGEETAATEGRTPVADKPEATTQGKPAVEETAPVKGKPATEETPAATPGKPAVEETAPVKGKTAAEEKTATATPAKAATEETAAPAAKKAPTPEELAQRQQQRANAERDAKITPEQRAHFDQIDQLKQQARSRSDWEYIRQLEHEANRPVSQRTSLHDDQAMLDAMAQSKDYGKHRDGTPVTAEEHAAAVRDLQRELDPQIAARRKTHEDALQGLQKEVDTRITGRDQKVTDDVAARIAAAVPDENGVRNIQMEGGASLGMGGAGATGAAAAKGRGARMGIEDATKPELWGTLGHKPAGQEAKAISYGKGGVDTTAVAEHATAQPARSSELALQVAAQRDASGVGTLGTNGPVGELKFTPQHGPDGKITSYGVGVPVRVGDEGAVLHYPQGVDITSGMGPARELQTKDAGGRKAQLTPDSAETLKGRNQLMSGEQALARNASDFAGKEVLGIGGGPTSIWAMEHALAGGAKSTEVAGAMPRPKADSAQGKQLSHVEGQIRELVLAGKAVPPELTEAHHQIVGDHVQAREGRLAEIDRDLAGGHLDPKAQERLQQEKAGIRAELDPFMGSRVDRNEGSLNNGKIKQVQADVMHVEPVSEAAPDGTKRDRVKVTYADGTSRVVDQVIPSIGGDPNGPGGINRMLKSMPKEMSFEPVIANGRVVGLASNPPGVSVSGAAMVGTLGTNMPAELLQRIPRDMRDAVLSSIIDHANRPDVSAGSRGIVPGIENVGQNPALMQEQLQVPVEQQAADRANWLDGYREQRAANFDGKPRFDNDVLYPEDRAR